MIESLSLLNFQTHRKATFSFGPVNTIVGPTDAGKSSLLRALRWVCLNDFDGPADSFIRWGRSFAKAVLTIDGKVITRRKGKADNRYELDGKVFRSFGAGKVPDPIADLLRMSEANFQRQDDSYFWFGDKPGEVSRHLNRIVNLSLIDDSLASIALTVRRTKAAVEISRDRLSAARAEKRQLAKIPQIDADLQQLERQDRQIAARTTRIDALRLLLAKADKATQTLANAGGDLYRGRQAVEIGERLAKLTQRVGELGFLIGDHAKTSKAIAIPVPRLPTRQMQLAGRLAEDCQRLQSILTQYTKTKETLCETKAKLKTAGEKLSQRMADGCPLCGRKTF